MRSVAFATVVGLALAALSAQANAQALSDDAIKALLVGKSADVGTDGMATYKADGSYEFYQKSNGANYRGKYTIAGGRVCAEFPNGQSRCDKITKEGDTVFLTNGSGTKFKMVVR